MRHLLAALAIWATVATACAPAPAPTAAPSPSKPSGSSPTAEAGKPAAPSKPSPAKVRVAQPVSSLTFVTVYVGRHKGLYAEESLEVEQLSTGGGGPDIQALLTGDVQLTITPGVGQMDAFRQGRKILAVFNALDKNIINVVMRKEVAEERGVNSQSPLDQKLRALKGLKIAGTRPGALTYQQAEYLVRRAGYEPQRDVQIVGAGEGAALIAALETGQVDVVLQSVPVPEQIVARGRGIMLINNAAGEDPSIVPFNMSTVLVTPEYAERNAEIVARFVRASRKANEWIAQATPEQIADAVSPDLGQTPREVLVAGAASVKTAVNRTGILDRKAVQTMVDMTQSGVNVDELYALFTDRFLK